MFSFPLSPENQSDYSSHFLTFPARPFTKFKDRLLDEEFNDYPDLVC